MSTFLGSLVASAISGTVLTEDCIVTSGGVRYPTRATRADTVQEYEDNTEAVRTIIRFPSADVPGTLGKGTRIEIGGRVFQALYCHLLEDVYQASLTAFGGLNARP